MSDRQIVVNDINVRDYYFYLKTFLDKTSQNHQFIVDSISSLNWDDKNLESATECINRVVDRLNNIRGYIGYATNALNQMLDIADKY